MSIVVITSSIYKMVSQTETNVVNVDVRGLERKEQQKKNDG